MCKGHGFLFNGKLKLLSIPPKMISSKLYLKLDPNFEVIKI